MQIIYVKESKRIVKESKYVLRVLWGFLLHCGCVADNVPPTLPNVLETAINAFKPNMGIIADIQKKHPKSRCLYLSCCKSIKQLLFQTLYFVVSAHTNRQD